MHLHNPLPQCSSLPISLSLFILFLLFPFSALSTPLSTRASTTTTECSSSQFSNNTFLTENAVTITSAIYYAAGTLTISSTTNSVGFCRVYAKKMYGDAGNLNETLDFEVWLPGDAILNLPTGNSGMAGTLDTYNMLPLLNQQYAVSASTSGHLASANNNGVGAPGVYLPYLHDRSQTLAWIHDSIALFTPAAKKIVALGYGREAGWSYYYGCSTGGAQGFAVAQLWEGQEEEGEGILFDGVYAGSPGFWYSHLALSFLWDAQKTEGDAYLDQDALELITSSVLDVCDGLDGVYDRLLENPLLCDFDIDVLACGVIETGNSTCLTAAQIAAAKAIYAGPKDNRTGAEVYPGFAVGSEVEWASGQEGTLADEFSIPILQNLVYDDLDYDASTFNWGSDIDTVDERAGVLIDETSTDLWNFKKTGAKMLVHQGWADPYNAADLPIQYLNRLNETFGTETEDFFNLFMVPGGGHCGAAPHYPSVPATYGFLDALVLWVEQGQRPQEILSTNAPDGSNRTRKLCPWPKTASYVGGDVDVWTSYECE
ncbi:tannase and feruloyl esterase [Saccharata proteae CBS 121410]|uniref:Carboxylic ester hydrolase n=1 Tax=Saccharata proteae CBS 121410 TaxID=1314787 RepID=A0A9P4HQ28_9PEZI|nr:tannase and feruloyl esterase [Saccharata proteae CBS 121410]